MFIASILKVNIGFLGLGKNQKPQVGEKRKAIIIWFELTGMQQRKG